MPVAPAPEPTDPAPDPPTGPGYLIDTRRRVVGHRDPSGMPPAQPPEPGWSASAEPARSGRAGRAVRSIRPGRGRRRVRRVLLGVLGVLLLLAGYLVWVPWSAWQRVERVDYAPAHRPVDTSGRTYLLVGSDSRAGLTDEQAARLGLDTETTGKRTDSIMLVHVSEAGAAPVVLSIPRDSYLPIPGKGQNKVNAAYALGGAALLTETLEQATGLFIDGYLEIGFGGFAGMVDAIGGVPVCVERDMKDELASLNVKAGCQTLDGHTALGYVRARYSDPRGDLGRAERQRTVLGAILRKAASPETVLTPGRYQALADATSTGLVVGSSTSPVDAVRIMLALRAVGNGEGISLQVPVANPAYQTKNAGVAVQWNDTQAQALFALLRADRPVTAPSTP